MYMWQDGRRTWWLFDATVMDACQQDKDDPERP